jgi:hypothetical protein
MGIQKSASGGLAKVTDYLTSLLVLATLVLFIWMFLSSDGLDQLARNGEITQAEGVNVTEVAHSFAAKWRHGMAGGSPLYMPGFFATAVAIWFWSRERRVARLLIEGTSLVFAASIIAGVLAPAGSALVIDSFFQQSGLRLLAVPSVPSLHAYSMALLTLVTWGTFIVASQRALTGRSFSPLLWPSGLAILLAIARPVTIDDAVSFWGAGTMRGTLTAVFSTLMIPVLAFVLARNAHPRKS